MHKKVPAEKARAAPKIGRSGLMACLSPNINRITPSGTARAKSRLATCAERAFVAPDRHQGTERERIERDVQQDDEKDGQPGK